MTTNSSHYSRLPKMSQSLTCTQRPTSQHTLVKARREMFYVVSAERRAQEVFWVGIWLEMYCGLFEFEIMRKTLMRNDRH